MLAIFHSLNIRGAQMFLMLASGLSFGTAALAETAPPRPAPASDAGPAQPWPIALRHVMQRVADVEWRLHEAAGQSCSKMGAATGIVPDSLDSYEDASQAEIARILNMDARVQVAAVAKGSPAAAAGIAPGDTIIAIDGQAFPPPQPASGKSGKNDSTALRATAALAALPTDRPVRITLGRGESTFTASLAAPRRCAARIYVDTANSLKAYSDGVDVVLTARIVDFTRSDDELAVIAGHELGHTIARDGAGGDGKGWRRGMEDRADAVGTDLAACAGYDAKTGAQVWPRWQSTFALGFLGFQQSPGKVRLRRAQERPFPAACPITGAPPLGS